jgi:SAM-dependent methyltransferase
MTTRIANVDMAAMELPPGSALVDVGCATGQLDRLLARAGYDVTGVEPDPVLRERFRAEADGVGPGRLDVVEGTAERLPFDDASIRAAVITEVLEHVDDPVASVRQLARVIEPGGTLCVSVPSALTERVYSRLHPRYPANTTHVRIWQRDDLRRLLEQSGFDVVRWEGRNFQPAVSWVFHSLLRSDSDHTGTIHQHVWVDYALSAVWAGLKLVRLFDPVMALGNRLFPKSWYVYCRRRP